MRVGVHGKKAGGPVTLNYGAADHMDDLTGVPLAIGALMIGRAKVTRRGVVAPESCTPPDAFIREPAKRDIVVYEGDELSVPVAGNGSERTEVEATR